jgi:hypothetical protein
MRAPSVCAVSNTGFDCSLPLDYGGDRVRHHVIGLQPGRLQHPVLGGAGMGGHTDHDIEAAAQRMHRVARFGTVLFNA